MRKIKPTKFDAISELVTGAFGSDDNAEEVTYLEGQTPPSEEEIDAKFKSMQEDWNAQQYARTRKPLYPDIGDQLDDLYKKGAFSDEMAAKIKKVKDDNPKTT